MPQSSFGETLLRPWPNGEPHECGAGHDVVEKLNYTAARMMQVWRPQFPTMAMAAPDAGNPRALAIQRPHRKPSRRDCVTYELSWQRLNPTKRRTIVLLFSRR
jgi:hypothetical protein